MQQSYGCSGLGRESTQSRRGLKKLKIPLAVEPALKGPKNHIETEFGSGFAALEKHRRWQSLGVLKMGE